MPLNVVASRLILSDGSTVSALLTEASDPYACLVLAHGAGAGMHHPFMATIAEGLAQRGVTTLRYQFPYMEAGSKRVDRPAAAHAAVRTAVQAASGVLPLFAGGKSFGARMTSQAQALNPLPELRGLVFFGFPLHPVGKRSVDRANHLSDVRIPMLLLQGTKDGLADLSLLEDVLKRLGPSATLVTVPDADHSFHVPTRSGRKDADVLEIVLDNAAQWLRGMTAHPDADARARGPGVGRSP